MTGLTLLVPAALAIPLPTLPLLAIVAITALFNGVTQWRIRHAESATLLELFSQILVDIATLSSLVFFSGGATNPLVSLLLPPVAIAALTLPVRCVFAIGLAATAAYSALMVDGTRAYDRARAGEVVDLPARAVTIHSVSLDCGEITGASGAVEEITLHAHVSKGTYIRSLARDIARSLGTVGHVTMLRRTRAGPFGLEQAISLDKLNAVGKGAALENVILPLEAGLDDIPALDLGPEQASMVRQGRVLTGLPQHDGLHWARAGDVPLALVELSGGDARVVRGFNLPDVAE